MIEPTADRRAPISPQLAVRVAGLGMVAFVLFGIIFFRLWFLQVLSGDQFLAEATQNRVRTQPQQAPRGFIVDREGNPLVENRKAIVLQLDPREIPEEERELASTWGDAKARRQRKRPQFRGPDIPIPAPPGELRTRFQRLGKVTGLSVEEIQELVVVGLYQEPFVPVRLTEDVTPAVRNYVEEHREDFRGLDIRTVYLREYPNKTVGAQLFGTVSEINPDQIGAERYRGVRQGSVVGQNGLERTYDKFLRGKDGVERIFVDAAGRPIGSQLSARGRAGRQLRTSIDLKLQKVAQASLARAARGKPGAFVAMDPYSGEVVAMGSAPSFDPNELARPLTDKRATELFGEDSGAPLTNRAVSSQYSTGSTFKPVTALAAMAAGVTTPDRVILDQGKIQLFPGKAGVRQNAGATPFGPVDLRKALSVSSDIYFYQVGKEIYYAKQSRALQSWARKLGFATLTGIDTGAETRGVVPSRAWRDNLNASEAKCRKGEEFPSGAKKAKGVPCGIADGSNRPYSAGDNVNLAIGQGDLQATPLQVALSYAAIATGGRIPTPHIGVRIEDEQGRLIQEVKHKRPRIVEMPADGLAAIRAGLHAAAAEPGGTSADVFAGWDQGRWPVFGKTGTAQTSKGDQSWYAAYVPRTDTNKRPLLVVATVEQGGFGAEAAAPLVRQILSQWYTKKPGPFNAGESTSL
jgi:penicillin-binding protein 2